MGLQSSVLRRKLLNLLMDGGMVARNVGGNTLAGAGIGAGVGGAMGYRGAEDAGEDPLMGALGAALFGGAVGGAAGGVRGGVRAIEKLAPRMAARDAEYAAIRARGFEPGEMMYGGERMNKAPRSLSEMHRESVDRPGYRGFADSDADASLRARQNNANTNANKWYLDKDRKSQFPDEAYARIERVLLGPSTASAKQQEVRRILRQYGVNQEAIDGFLASRVGR